MHNNGSERSNCSKCLPRDISSGKVSLQFVQFAVHAHAAQRASSASFQMCYSAQNVCIVRFRVINFEERRTALPSASLLFADDKLRFRNVSFIVIYTREINFWHSLRMFIAQLRHLICYLSRWICT